jgi:hypothetical protein
MAVLSLAFCALLIVGLQLAGAEPAVPNVAQKRVGDQLIWRGRSGDFLLTWRTSDLRVTSGKRSAQVAFSVFPSVKRDFEAFLAALRASGAREGATAEPCTYERTFRILSVVGSLLSLEDGYYAYCRGWAHPAVATRFTTLDVTRPGELVYVEGAAFPPIDLDVSRLGKAVSLTDIAAESDILEALLGDPIVRRALQQVGQLAPSTLEQLQQLLAHQSLEAGECLFRFPRDVFTRFAFHHLEGSRIAVRLGLPPIVEPCRTQHAQLGLLLPIPRALKKDLTLAASRQAGFLMRDHKKIAGKRVTTVAFSTGKFAPD